VLTLATELRLREPLRRARRLCRIGPGSRPGARELAGPEITLPGSARTPIPSTAVSTTAGGKPRVEDGERAIEAAGAAEVGLEEAQIELGGLRPGGLGAGRVPNQIVEGRRADELRGGGIGSHSPPGVHLVLDSASDLPDGELPSEELVTIVGNLVDNALEALDDRPAGASRGGWSPRTGA
jgi:hypothetical protein